MGDVLTCEPGFLLVVFVVTFIFIIREEVSEVRVMCLHSLSVLSSSCCAAATTLASMLIPSAPLRLVVNMKWSKFQELCTYTWACALYLYRGSVPPGACDGGIGSPSIHAEVAGAWITVPAAGLVPTVVCVMTKDVDKLVIVDAPSAGEGWCSP